MDEDYRLAALVAASVDGFDDIVGRGEKTALRVLELVAAVLESRALEFGGTLRSSSGPSFLLEFPSALSAAECALRVREGGDLGCDPRVRLRMGIHLGDVWFFRSEALGEGVDIALRLAGEAAPWAVVVSAEVLRQIQTRLPVQQRSLPSVELPGTGRLIEAFEIAPGRPEDGPAASSTETAGPAAAGYGAWTTRLAQRAHLLRERGARILPATVARLASRVDDIAERGLVALGGRDRRTGTRSPAEGEDEDLEAEREEARVGALRIHLAAYGLISALLLAAWFVVSPLRHPWFLYPMGAWGIGLAEHVVAHRMRTAHRREEAARLSCEQRRTLRRLHRVERGFAAHATAFAATNGFLFMVNMIASPGFPWFLFPAAGWTIGLVSHRLFYRVRCKALLGRLRRLGVVRGELARVPAAPATVGRLGALVDEASHIKELLQRQMEASESLSSRFAADTVPLLDRYVAQIRELNEHSRELEGLLERLSEEQLDAEIARLEAGRAAARSPAVRAEYDRALAQHRQQRESLAELRSQQEILDLRIKSSVLALKRLEMDVARMKGLEARQVMESLREQSEELTRYLEDLKASYAELDS